MSLARQIEFRARLIAYGINRKSSNFRRKEKRRAYDLRRNKELHALRAEANR